MKGHVPDSILERRDKIGFETPESQWLDQLREWVDSLCFRSGSMEDMPALRVAG